MIRDFLFDGYRLTRPLDKPEIAHVEQLGTGNAYLLEEHTPGGLWIRQAHNTDSNAVLAIDWNWVDVLRVYLKADENHRMPKVGPMVIHDRPGYYGLRYYQFEFPEYECFVVHPNPNPNVVRCRGENSDSETFRLDKWDSTGRRYCIDRCEDLGLLLRNATDPPKVVAVPIPSAYVSTLTQAMGMAHSVEQPLDGILLLGATYNSCGEVVLRVPPALVAVLWTYFTWQVANDEYGSHLEALDWSDLEHPTNEP